MFPNLNAELARKGLDIEDIASVIGRDKRTARNKINGVNEFTLVEVFAIRDNLFPDLSLEYLFKRLRYSNKNTTHN